MSLGPAAAHPDSLALYALDVLEPDDASLVERHLAGCAQCRRELSELREGRALLDLAPADRVLAELVTGSYLPPVGDDDLLLHRTLTQVRRERARARRPRLLAVAAAVLVAAGVVGGAGVAIGRATAPAPPVVVAAPFTTARGSDPATGVAMVVRTRPAKGWVRLSVQVSGVPVGTVCRIVAVGRDGTREDAGSWVVATPPAGAAAPFVDAAAAIPVDQLDGVELLDGTGKRLVEVEL